MLLRLASSFFHSANVVKIYRVSVRSLSILLLCISQTVVPTYRHDAVLSLSGISIKNCVFNRVTVISVNYVGALRTCCMLNVITGTAEHQQTASRYNRKLFRNSCPISQKTQLIPVTKIASP